MSSVPSMAEFVGMNGRFAGGRVHTVAPQKWIDDIHVPGPACRTPSGTFDPRDFKPTEDGLSCKRCQRWHPDRRDAVSLQTDAFPDLKRVIPKRPAEVAELERQLRVAERYLPPRPQPTEQVNTGV